MARIIGVDAHRRTLRGMRGAVKNTVKALYATGQAIELDAEQSITAGSISGKGHVPSRPGEPPNRETGALDTNIDTTIAKLNPPTVHVTSHAPYSAALEYGTSKMAERPFMRPAVDKNRKLLAEEMAKAVRETIRANRKG